MQTVRIRYEHDEAPQADKPGCWCDDKHGGGTKRWEWTGGMPRVVTRDCGCHVERTKLGSHAPSTNAVRTLIVCAVILGALVKVIGL